MPGHWLSGGGGQVRHRDQQGRHKDNYQLGVWLKSEGAWERVGGSISLLLSFNKEEDGNGKWIRLDDSS